MNDVNWWLMGLAFLLGLLLTFAFMIRRVKREVPIYAESSSGTRGRVATIEEPDVDVAKPDVKGRGVAAGAAAGAAAAGTAAAAKFTGGKEAREEPYGSGSLRLAPGASAPSRYTIKGNEDSMLYHTPDSPSYEQTIAEIWFVDEETAERAGFTRWDKGRAGGGAAKFADVPPGPYGAGSAEPGSGGSGPEGWTVKGNMDSMLYHTPDSPSYEQTIAEVWFVDEETAVKAGFGPWHKGEL
ncbi:MAG TPA: hypothetical protein VLU24_10730 [Mycobacterium sp.]|nr:hypothetical protein [Mycobacterium sp.]